MKNAKEKILALLEGLDISNPDDFLEDAKVGDYRNLGKRYFAAAKRLRFEIFKQDKRNPSQRE